MDAKLKPDFSRYSKEDKLKVRVQNFRWSGFFACRPCQNTYILRRIGTTCVKILSRHIMVIFDALSVFSSILHSLKFEYKDIIKPNKLTHTAKNITKTKTLFINYHKSCSPCFSSIRVGFFFSLFSS